MRSNSLCSYDHFLGLSFATRTFERIISVDALAYVFVPILAKVFLSEDLELKSIIGALIIIIGVYISVR